MFHDASVTRFTFRGQDLHIETEAFALSPIETVPPARIVIAESKSISINGQIGAFEVESDEAEIYSLESSAEGVLLDLIWHFRKPARQEIFRSYLFAGATLTVHNLHREPLFPITNPEGGQR
jgi:hypothetical protein